MKIGGKPSRPPLDLALSLQIARLTNTDENITLLNLTSYTKQTAIDHIIPGKAIETY